ncbi:hypothetical protein ACN47E_000359 [Coniothyrium glycines]
MRAPVLPPAGFNHQHTGQHHHQHGRPANFPMADPATYMATDEELAHLQKLASDFEPEVTGPLVGERQSSSAITSEYANADPIYRIKTAALPAKYAYFRTCRGDGHCGWRAIAFTYFEALLRVGDVNKFQDEEARLNSLGNLLEHVGWSRDIWIDFAEPVFDLLRKMAESLSTLDTNTAASTLLQTFNDMGESMAIITYVKLLTSAWIQTHPDEYRHFMPTDDVKAYCSMNIEPQACEADNIGIAALTDALVKPAGFGLEIWYLDRSPGEEINRSFHAEPTDHRHIPIANAPMLRLLYRPGHYDILYMAGDVPQPPPPPPQHTVQTFMANYTEDFVPTASNVTDVMTMIPGMYSAGLGSRWPSLSYDFSPSPAPQQQQQQQQQPVQAYPSVATPITPVSNHLDFNIPLHTSQYEAPSHHSIHLDQPPVVLPIHSAPPPPVSLERVAPVVERGGPFRPSMYQLEPGFGSSMQAQPFQTSIFRNSHFNTAHFMNPDFQPEEWCPDGEYATGNKGRHKSHSS